MDLSFAYSSKRRTNLGSHLWFFKRQSQPSLKSFLCTYSSFSFEPCWIAIGKHRWDRWYSPSFRNSVRLKQLQLFSFAEVPGKTQGVLSQIPYWFHSAINSGHKKCTEQAYEHEIRWLAPDWWQQQIYLATTASISHSSILLFLTQPHSFVAMMSRLLFFYGSYVYTFSAKLVIPQGRPGHLAVIHSDARWRGTNWFVSFSSSHYWAHQLFLTAGDLSLSNNHVLQLNLFMLLCWRPPAWQTLACLIWKVSTTLLVMFAGPRIHLRNASS